MKKSRVHVTDHAVLRYLERVHGVDMEGLRRRIGKTVDTAVKAGANGLMFEGVKYRLHKNTVITIVAGESIVKRRNRKVRRGKIK